LWIYRIEPDPSPTSANPLPPQHPIDLELPMFIRRDFLVAVAAGIGLSATAL
jgi:hypothetical protein